MEYRFCHMCGNKMNADAKFCGVCGTPVFQPMAADPEPVVPEVVAEPAMAEPFTAPAEVPVEVETPVEEVSVKVETPVEEVPVEEAPAEETPVEAAFIPDKPVAEEAPAVEVPVEVALIAEEAPAAVQSAPSKPAKSPYPRRGAGRTILAILVCLFLFLWTFVGILIYDIRTATSGEQLAENLGAVLTDSDLASMPASQIFTDITDPNITLVEWAVQEVAFNYEGTVDVSSKDIEKFLKDSNITDFLTDKLALYINDLYTGSSDFEVTTEEVQTLLEENADLVEEVFGAPLPQEDIEAFVLDLEDKELLEDLNVKSLKKDLAPVYYGVQIGLSYWVAGFFGVLALLFVIMLAKTNKWSWLRTCGDAGITWVVLGLLLLIPTALTIIIPDIWNPLLGNIPFVGSLIGVVLTAGLIPALILTGVGAVLIIVKIVGKKIVLKSANKQV